MKDIQKTCENRIAGDAGSAHAFSATGTASFIRCMRNTSIEWQADRAIIVEAEGGMAKANGSFSVLPKGVYQISPYEPARLIARYKEPIYLMTVEKLYDVLCNRYVLDVKLFSKWRLNFWPLFLDYYLTNGKWASSIEEMRELGEIIVANYRENGIPGLKKLSKFKRLRREFPIFMLTRFGVDSSLRKWSKKNWANIYRKFFNSPHFDEMAENAELLMTIRGKGDNLVALKSVMKRDDLAFAIPMKLAAADTLRIDSLAGLAKIDGTRGGSERSKVISSLQLDSALAGPMPLPLRLTAERIQIPLVSGLKKAYGATMTAPIIVKGDGISGSIERNRPHAGTRVKAKVLGLINPDRDEEPSEDQADLKLKIEGVEA